MQYIDEQSADSPDGDTDEMDKAVAIAIAEIKTCLSHFVLDSRGNLTPSAELQLDIRASETRANSLYELIAAVCPDEAYIGVWDCWLSGKQKPFEGPKLPKVGPSSENPGQTLKRAVDRVAKHEEKAGAGHGGNTNQVVQLEHVRAFEKAALHFIISQELLKSLMPIYAMGPAWTVMRAISGYSSADAAEPTVDPFDSLDIEEAAFQASQRRAKETDAILQGLDFWSGDPAFEHALREAIVDVVKRFEPLEGQHERDGRRHRSKARMKNTINPEGSADAKEVLRRHRRNKRPPTRHDVMW